MKIWNVEININASNIITIEVEANTVNKARKIAESIVKKQYKPLFIKINDVKFVGFKMN